MNSIQTHDIFQMED